MLDKNLSILKGKNIALYNLILKEQDTDNQIEILSTKTGGYTLKLNGKLLHSLYKPEEEAKKYIEKYELDKKEIIILLGFGFGYYLDEIVKLVSDDTQIFIVEHNIAVLRECLKYRNMSEILGKENIHIYHTSQKNEFTYEVESSFKIGIIPEYEIINHKVEYNIYSNEYIKFVEILKDEISNILLNTSTIFEFSKMWHRNSFLNMPYFKESLGINKMYGKYKGVPAVIVSAGPSLDKNIKYLEWIKGKAIIIAVGTALKKLLKDNIIPDFVMALDGGEPNWEHFKRIKYDEIPLIYEPMAHPKILKHHSGKKIVFVSQNIVGAWGEHVFGVKGFLKMGGSVALSAYDFAVYIGCNPVILIGQDLAYTGGRTHVSGSTYEKDIAKENKENMHQMTLQDIYGDPILSDRKFAAFKLYFERFISGGKILDPSLQVIDCTEGGAKIEYTDIMTLKDAYTRYIKDKKVDIEQDLENLFDQEDFSKSSEKLQSAKEEISEKLKDTLEEIKKGIKILKRAISKKDYSRIGYLDTVDKKINENIEVSNLVRYISQHIISDVIKKTKESKNEKEVFEKNLKLYEGIEQAINFNLKCINEMDEIFADCKVR